MRQITGNKLLVRALKEEGVDTLFGYPGACTIDISDELYKQDDIKIILPRHEQALVHEADGLRQNNGKSGGYVWLPADRARRTLSQVLPQPIMTAFPLSVSQARWRNI